MKEYTLITGACGGLGKAFVAECAKANENLILIGTNQTKVNNFTSEISSNFNKIDILSFVCDQSNKQSRETLFESLSKLNITKAILNAGYIDEGAIATKKIEEQENVIKTNCEATVAIAKYLIDKSVQSKTKLGIVVTSSLSAYYPMPQMAVYAASKAFLLHYFLAAREEYKNSNIKITVVCPGGIPTTAAMKDAIRAQGVGGKLSSTSPEKVAKCALKGLEKNKPVAIPGTFNKLLMWIGTRPSKTFTAKQIGKRWKKSQKKRTTLK